jgi:competence protein CoiA
MDNKLCLTDRKMKYAIFHEQKVEARKNAIGYCPICDSVLIPKCGEVKVKHWAHKGKRTCDIWKENETEWHRTWKNKYTEEWQEFTMFDKRTGEKHTADVRTSHGLVIEFQHSRIDPQERRSREDFYKNMVWVADGTRLKRDYPRFLKGFNDLRKTNKPGFFIVDFPEECFPSAWTENRVPVIFDFLGLESIEDPKDLRTNLYCLFPKQQNREVIVVSISRNDFIEKTISGAWFGPQKEIRKQPTIKQRVIRRREPTHYYDPKKNRYVKKRRF